MLASLSVLTSDVAIDNRPAGLSFGQCLGRTLAWCALLSIAAVVVSRIFPEAGEITQATFSRWDVEHYRYIRDHGYDVQRTAFFPLFPFLWRWLAVPPIAMGLVNLGLFAGSFAWLAWQFGWSGRQQVLLLAVPSLVFMALPYSEAVFFISGALVLVGLRRNLLGLYFLGLLLSCVSRSAAFVLLPAVIATEWLAPESRNRNFGRPAVAAAATLLGLGISVGVHYWYTGRWFVFFAAQKLWHNELRWPALPLSNWGGSFPTRYEAPALLIGLGCAVGLAGLAYRHWRQPLPAADRPAIFSLAYVAGITLITLATKGGELVSLSRYVYATPYFLLLLADFTGRPRLSSRQLLALFGLMELTWLGLFAAYGHIRTLLGFSMVSGAVLLWLANAHCHPRVRRFVLLPTVAGSAALLLVLLFRFLRHEWVA